MRNICVHALPAGELSLRSARARSRATNAYTKRGIENLFPGTQIFVQARNKNCLRHTLKNVPLLLVISSVQAPFCDLSQYLSNLINNIINNNPYCIKDQFEFQNYFENITIPNNYFMSSVYIVSIIIVWTVGTW